MQSIVVNMPFALTDIQASDYNSMITFWAFAYEWHVSLQMTPCSNQNGKHNTAALQLAPICSSAHYQSLCSLDRLYTLMGSSAGLPNQTSLMTCNTAAAAA